MSWDYTEYSKPCPCVKGLVLVRDGSNDWGQTSHDETILCPECKEKDRLEKAIKKERKRIAEHKIDMVLAYFKENYTDRLLSKFINAKSKKDIWKVAYEIGLETYSESSFYKHTKSETIVIKTYVSSNIRWQNIKKIVLSLSISDSKLDELFNDAASHIKEFEDEEYKLSYLKARGKI